MRTGKSLPAASAIYLPAVFSRRKKTFPLPAPSPHSDMPSLYEDPCNAVGCSYSALNESDRCRGHRAERRNPWLRRRARRARRAGIEDRFEQTLDSGVLKISYGLDGLLHRVGAPAIEAFGTTGAWEKRWYYRGVEHRIDGPATVTSRGGHLTEKYYLGGVCLFDRDEYLREIELYSGDRLRDEFAISSYAPLLAEGVAPRKVVELLTAGLITVAGMREVIEGAPVEWVVAYESGTRTEA